MPSYVSTAVPTRKTRGPQRKALRNFRIDDTLYRAMQRVAWDQGYTLSEWVRRVAERAIEAYDSQGESVHV